MLVSHSDGTLKVVATAGERVIAVAMDDAVAGDLVAVEVMVGHAYATE